MSASSKENSIKERSFDIEKELVSLIPLLYRYMGFPRALFESDPSTRAKSKFSFPCVKPEDLYFSTFYGDTWIRNQSTHMRKMAVKRRIRRRSPEDISPELIRGNIAECIDSVKNVEKEHTTLKLIIGKVYFEGKKDMTIDDQNRFFEGNIIGRKTSVNLPGGPMSFYHDTCEWTSPSNVQQILMKNGFSITSRESLDTEVSLALRGKQLRKRIGNTEFLHFDNNLKLNPATLAVESWRVQYCYPMTHYILHGFPSSNDIIIRTNIKAYASFVELFALNGEHLPGLMAIDGDSGSFIQRTDVGFRLINNYKNVKSIMEKINGERIHLQYKNISCFMNLATMRYLYLNSQTNEFTLTDDQSYEVIIEFPLTQNREELIEVVTRSSLILFSKANNENEFPLTTSPKYTSESDGTRVPWLDIHPILRLHNEQGDLYQLLGLGDSSCRKEYETKAIDLKRLLLRNRQREWFRRMKLDFNELMGKLTSACLVYNIES